MKTTKDEVFHAGRWSPLPHFLMRNVMPDPHLAAFTGYIACLPEKWMLSKRGLYSQLVATEGLYTKNAVDSSLRKLVKMGIAHRTLIVSPEGRTYGTDYHIHMVEHRNMLTTTLAPMANSEEYAKAVALRRKSGVDSSALPISGEGNAAKMLKHNIKETRVCAPHSDVREWLYWDSDALAMTLKIPESAGLDYEVTLRTQGSMTQFWDGESSVDSEGYLVARRRSDLTIQRLLADISSGKRPKIVYASRSRYTFYDDFRKTSEERYSNTRQPRTPMNDTTEFDEDQPKVFKGKRATVAVPKRLASARVSTPRATTNRHTKSSVATPQNRDTSEENPDNTAEIILVAQTRRAKVRKKSKKVDPLSVVASFNKKVFDTYGDTKAQAPKVASVYALKAYIKKMADPNDMEKLVDFTVAYWGNIVTDPLSWMRKPKPPKYPTAEFFMRHVGRIHDYYVDVIESDAQLSPIFIEKVDKRKQTAVIDSSSSVLVTDDVQAMLDKINRGSKASETAKPRVAKPRESKYSTAVPEGYEYQNQ